MRVHAVTGNRWRGAVMALAMMAGLIASTPSQAASPGSAGSPGSPGSVGSPDATATADGTAETSQLTNLDYLDYLVDDIAPPDQARHTTYRLADEPHVSVPWTYAEREDDGSYRRVGGGDYDEATDTYTQGAFNADDISRAAVVYLRHYERHGDEHSRDAAYELLRGLTYLQPTSGPNRGNVVLWQQPDGTLNRSAEPHEDPAPSDSGPSFWLARTVWALGEGYAAFRDTDPDFARFLQDRTELALDAIDRQVLKPNYGTYQVVDGQRMPAWLIFDGADASSEAVLGLAAYVRAGGDRSEGADGGARDTLRKLSEGIARMSAGDATTWPFGATLPTATSRTVWHGWASQMPAALAETSGVLKDRSFLKAAVADTAVFTPHLLVSGGPDNGWMPAPGDRSQIAYGVDSRVQDLLAVSDATGSSGLRKLAGTAASWYFGNNEAGEPTYDPKTGITFDGVDPGGKVNRNAGAESVIHGLLSMLALDDAPDVAASARVAKVSSRETREVLEAEDAHLDGDAEVVTPESAWTGESSWSGGKYVSLEAGSSLALDVPGSATDRLVMPVVHRVDKKRGGSTSWTADGRSLDTLPHGGAGAQGVSAVPGALEMDSLNGRLAANEDSTELRATADPHEEPLLVDTVLVQPVVEHVVREGDGRAEALLRSFDTSRQVVPVNVPGDGTATVSSYDEQGELVARKREKGEQVDAPVVPGGFTVVER